ncbi:FtsX-like permease family protein [[Eubacterium] hominis]|uniref:ABC transporter permease n=1 Tax=[Eubacterium] hominis TaxID=2764325 RepID=UPI003A4DB291
MWFHILKKDLIKRKSVNMILFLFITLATVFVSSSVNNIMVVSSAVDYYMDYANVPDLTLILNSDKDIKDIERWLKQKQEKKEVSAFAQDEFLSILDKNIEVKENGSFHKIKGEVSNLYMSMQNETYTKVFDQNENAFRLKEGELALSKNMMEKNDLQIGDVLRIVTGNQNKSFVIRYQIKDAAYGTEMIGMSRLIVSDEDYQAYRSVGQKLKQIHVMCDDVNMVNEQLDNLGYDSIINIISRDTYKLAYSFDMIVAGLLIGIGICLILISLLVLRFTLVFTMEEQYQEIGILKAIGLRDFAIKKLYLVKYLVIVCVGAMLGLLLSFPLSKQMMQSLSSNMIIEHSDANMGVNVLCALIIITIVLFFCYYCTRRLHKVSAITAIRGGADGESFAHVSRFTLSRYSSITVPIYLGIHDIITHMRRYIVLMITFSISFILITIPLNTVNTMQSDEMIRKMMVDPESAIVVRKIERIGNEKYQNIAQLEEGMERVKQEMKDKGYEVEMCGVPILFLKYGDKKDTNRHNYMSIQFVGKQDSFVPYEEGSAPILENEIAFSKKVLEREGWSIGDKVITEINGEEKHLLITGSYSDYMQLGKSARLSPAITSDEESLFDYWGVMVYMDTSLSQIELVKQLQKEFPDYEWKTSQEIIDQNVGGIQDILQQMLLPMTGMLCGVIMLITVLMEKLFIAREKGEIAMLKSIGFRNSSIRLWQLSRMIVVTCCSMIIAIPLSLLSNAVILKPIFAIMGANIAIQVNALQAYIIYPTILLIGILIAALLGSMSIKNIDIREMNHLE